MMNAVKRHVAAMIAAVGQPRWGLVASVDSNGPAVRVRLMPEDVLSGWLPITAAASSSGWGVYSLPSTGDMAFLAPDMGDSNHPVVVGFSHNDGARPAQAASAIGGAVSHAQPGEIMLVSKAGAVIRLAADGSIYIQGNVFIAGALSVRDGITAGYGGGDQVTVQGHTHGGVLRGGAHTNNPDPGT